MSERKNEYTPKVVTPPGETLGELLDERGMTQADLAARMGRPKKTINEIVNGKTAITPDTALQLETVLGTPAAFWNARQQQFDEAKARLEENAGLANATSWLKDIPVREMEAKEWIPKTTSPIERLRECLRFFAVASPQQWREVYEAPQARFRKSAAFTADAGAVSAWLRRGEIAAAEIGCKAFNEQKLRGALVEIRSLTRLKPQQFEPRLKELCREAGVAVVFVPEVKGCRASGAARWLAPDKGLIQLSLRYRTNDHLWFTFFHEAAHLLLHGKRDVFLDFEKQGAEVEEIEANTFAQDCLIPPAALKAFLDSSTPTGEAISRFAKEIGISAGIVVGRLQREKALLYTQLNHLKEHFRFVGEG